MSNEVKCPTWADQLANGANSAALRAAGGGLRFQVIQNRAVAELLAGQLAWGRGERVTDLCTCRTRRQICRDLQQPSRFGRS
jgi:hypothetical protein